MCVKCGRVLTLDHFYMHRDWDAQSNRDAWCRECAARCCTNKEETRKYCWYNNRRWSDDYWEMAKKKSRYLKKLVYLRSYHGKRLDALAEELRRTFARFPRTTRIVFDHRGLGDAFPQFLAQPWIDPESGKESPPWTLDDERTIIHNAVPILRSVKASAQINQQLVSCLRVA